MIHTNRCKHCGKPESEHLWEYEYYCNPQSHVDQRKFLDSGLAALDAHKEGLYEALKSIIDTYKIEHAGFAIQSAIDAGESILNQIEKEK